ncbi:MAG: hypothetical protein WCG21_14635 [Eubacteriales bacterium]
MIYLSEFGFAEQGSGFSLGHVGGRDNTFLARSGPRIAKQSCGIYSKSIIPSLEGVLRTLRKIVLYMQVLSTDPIAFPLV